MKIDDLTFLVCDDSILARKQLKDIINSLGSPTIIEAANGQLAIDMYKEHKPDLTFVDIVMPVKDGNAAITEIIAFDPDATIFVASSVGTQSELKKALEAGASDFIQKPIDKDQVIDLIKKHVGGN
ncbi:response regulator [Agathobacter sp.]